MAESATTPEPVVEPAAVETAPVVGTPKLLTKIEIGAVLAAVVILQCGLVFFFLPSAAPPAPAPTAGQENAAT